MESKEVKLNRNNRTVVTRGWGGKNWGDAGQRAQTSSDMMSKIGDLMCSMLTTVNSTVSYA